MSMGAGATNQVDLADMDMSDDITSNTPTNQLDAEEEVQNDLDDQQKMQQEMEKQRRQAVDPQMKQLRKAMTGIDKGMLQSQQMMQSNTRTANDMSRQMVSANNSIDMLDKLF